MSYFYKSLVLTCKSFFSKFDKNPFYHLIESTLIIGPFLIGWLLGLLRYPPSNIKFKLAFQSGFIFVIYMFLLTLNIFLAWLNILGYLQCSYYIASILVCLYIITTTLILSVYLLKQKVMISSLLDKFFNQLL